YFQNLFGIGLLIPIMDYHIKDSPRLLKLSKKQKGFLAYDQELIESPDPKKRWSIKRGREKYLQQKENGELPESTREELTIMKLDAHEVGLSQFPAYTYYIFRGGLAGEDSSNIWNYGHYSLKGAIEHTKELADARISLEQ
ncbi:MAG: hypothetical protein RIF46_16475, partial [Cyclobacteriaceae bacterium]